MATTAENRALTSSTTPILISERLAPIKGTVTREEVMESGKKKILHTAKVSHAGKVNQNNRLYPREVITANIDRLKPLLADGFLTGAVDHGYGGNLQDTCLLWRDIWMEADGAVKAKFEVIVKHSKGSDFQAQIDAGMAVGFSTSGYGSAHAPSAAERLAYGLGDDSKAVIMDAN